MGFCHFSFFASLRVFDIAFHKLHCLVFVAMDRVEAMHYSDKQVALSCICSDNEEGQGTDIMDSGLQCAVMTQKKFPDRFRSPWVLLLLWAGVPVFVVFCQVPF